MTDDDDLVFYIPYSIIKFIMKYGRVIMKGSVQWSTKQSGAEFCLQQGPSTS